MREYFSHISALALVPEQLVAYVTAVAQTRATLCGECVAYDFEGSRTLIAYRPGATPGEDMRPAVDTAVRAALADARCENLTVISPARPRLAPDEADCREDTYMLLPLPAPAPGQKLRNMLRRAMRECSVTEESWGTEHSRLTQAYLDSRPLEAGTIHIFRRIPNYLAASPGAVLFAARDVFSRLKALAIGDFSSLTTAFYMFAFRAADCPPGAADLLLRAVVSRARANGHRFVNMGLGINKGIADFKKKWGPLLPLPYIQTSWKPDSSRGKKAASTADDVSAVFRPPTAAQRLRHFFLGEQRPFDCLQIEVSSRCAGKCFYCPHTGKAGVWRARDMKDKVFAALLPLISRAKRVHLQGWGEPLLHPRFFDYARAAARAGAAGSTTTCGLGMSPAIAEKFVRNGIDIVAFSLAGADEKSNAARAGIPLAKVCESILTLNRVRQNLGANRPRQHLAYLMLASGYKAVAGLPELMERLDVPTAVVSTLDYITGPDMEEEAYLPSAPEKIERALAVLREAAERAARRGREIHYALPCPAERKECGERAATSMYIDAEGRIAPCIYLNLPTDEADPRRRVFGSSLLKNPLDIWNCPEYADFRRRLAQGRPDASCLRCAKRFVGRQ
jgi:MoaA/NifB/PqqE/SkfB family radical SAM enzyme